MKIKDRFIKLDWEDNTFCIIRAAMDKEMEKPPHLRTKVFYISCPCKNCKPYTL